MNEQIGLVHFLPAMAGDMTLLPLEALQVLQGCGIILPPISSPGDGGAFNEVSFLWLQFNPELQGLIDCLQGAASMEELDVFFSGSSAAPHPEIEACLAQYQDMLPSFG